MYFAVIRYDVADRPAMPACVQRLPCTPPGLRAASRHASRGAAYVTGDASTRRCARVRPFRSNAADTRAGAEPGTLSRSRASPCCARRGRAHGTHFPRWEGGSFGAGGGSFASSPPACGHDRDKQSMRLGNSAQCGMTLGRDEQDERDEREGRGRERRSGPDRLAGMRPTNARPRTCLPRGARSAGQADRRRSSR